MATTKGLAYMDTAIMVVTPQQIESAKIKLDSLTKDVALKVFSYFLNSEERLNQKTLAQYYYQIKTFFAWCEVNNVTPWQANKQDVVSYVDYLADLARTKQGNKLASATINSRLITVRRFFESLKTHGYIIYNPAKEVKQVRDNSLPVSKMKCLDTSMIPIKNLLDAAEKYTLAHKIRNQAAIVLMGFLGLRGFEVCQLKRKDIDENNRSILIHGKHSKDRITGMSVAQWQYVKALLDTIPIDQEAYLFTSESHYKSSKNPHLSARGLRYMIDDLLVKIGLKQPRKSSHSLRHTCGVSLRKKGYTLEQIASLLGHSDINTTKVYTEYLDLVVNPISASLDEVLA